MSEKPSCRGVRCARKGRLTKEGVLERYGRSQCWAQFACHKEVAFLGATKANDSGVVYLQAIGFGLRRGVSITPDFKYPGACVRKDTA